MNTPAGAIATIVAVYTDVRECLVQREHDGEFVRFRARWLTPMRTTG